VAGRWLLAVPFFFISLFVQAPDVHPVHVQNLPPRFAPSPAVRLLGGDSAELDAQLTQPQPGPKNRLRIADGSLDLPVGVYTDCSGMAPVSYEGAAIDSCLGGRLYFIGHNPGPFAPLRDLGVGSTIVYYDGSGMPHGLRIVATRTWSRWWGSPPLASGDVVAQFQTCITLDANWDEILDAVPA
jgi:hypothetical protein